MARMLELSDDGAEDFVRAMLSNDLDNINEQLNDTTDWHHPEDIKSNKKVAKAIKKLLKYYGA